MGRRVDVGRNRGWSGLKKQSLLAGPRDEIRFTPLGDRRVLSGVGWIIFCQHTGKSLVGSFWEMYLSASSYRAELLGLCSFHLLVLALSKFYKISGWKATLCYDNLSALQLSSQDRRRIKPSAACSDLHRSLCSMKNNFTGCFKY